MRCLCSSLVVAAAFIAVSNTAQALTAAEVFAKAHHAIYLVIVTSDEPGKDLCELDLAQVKPGFDKPAEIAPPDSLQVGETVFAIGSPRGMELTISNGIISGFREANGGMRLRQTTAPFSPGSSGGGLFDDQGRLVGIATLIAKDSQNLNFAISAQYIRSVGISAGELLKQHPGAAMADNIAMQDAQSTTARKPIAARLASYQSLGDSNVPARIYEQMTKKGQLAGLDDNTAIRKVYEALIRQHVADQLRWSEGGAYVSEFQIQLRRSGEVMFVIPARVSGLERFDQEARRAIGAASPLPVPRDNEAFDHMSEIRIAVQAPERATQSTQPVKPTPKKKPK